MSTAYGSFPLHYAAASGEIRIIQNLLDHAQKLGRAIRNEVQMRDCEGQTPLHIAIQNRYVKVNPFMHYWKFIACIINFK